MWFNVLLPSVVGEESSEPRLMEDPEKSGASEKSAEPFSSVSERSQNPEPPRRGDSSRAGTAALPWALVFSGVEESDEGRDRETSDPAEEASAVPLFTVPYLSSSSEPGESWVKHKYRHELYGEEQVSFTAVTLLPETKQVRHCLFVLQ